MKSKTTKANEPSVRAKLSAAFLAALEQDFQEHGVEVIAEMRKTHPERYAELAAKLIMTTEPKAESIEQAQSMQEIGEQLLKSVGIDAPTPQQISDAVIAKDNFINRLHEIAGNRLH